MNNFQLPNWFQNTAVPGISLGNFGVAVAAMLLAYLLITLGLRVALRHLKALAERTSTSADDVLVETLDHTHRGLIVLVAVLMGVGMLDLPDRWAGRVGASLLQWVSSSHFRRARCIWQTCRSCRRSSALPAPLG